MYCKDVITGKPDSTLVVIGNGFDLMHGVLSGYYHFRDSLGKYSELRAALETWIMQEDLWADFEESLAYLNSHELIENAGECADILGVLEQDDDDFSAADFFAAAEMAVMPAQIIQRELPKKFKHWVQTLRPSSDDKPLADILNKKNRYINFNYTEFLESLYDIPKERITYIHGCRQNKNEPLILGHSPDAGPTDDETESSQEMHFGRGMTQTLFDLQETAWNHIGNYFDETTKKTDEIIKKNHVFFESISSIDKIIVIGHSLSIVDYPYFAAMIRCNKAPAVMTWDISWHSVNDLKKIQDFAAKMGISVNQLRLFRATRITPHPSPKS
ncbi:hypothetical protein AGMMS49587_17010 [Spirochaetia bacterium]|nr:hypothetical protein AGMMS49587_17010 [Spirochaetia bacterium]